MFNINEDDFLFEIDDTAYLVTYVGLFTLAVMALILVYFITDGWTHGDHRSLFVTSGSIAAIITSLINLSLYFFKKNMKIRFYKDGIVRTRLKMKVDLNKIVEAYILKLNVSDGPIKKRISSKLLILLSSIIAGPFIYIPILIGSFLISLFNGRRAFYMNTLLLIEDDGYTAVSFPLNVIKKKDHELISSYLKGRVDVELKNIQHGFIKVAGEPIKNFPRENDCNV